MFSCNPNGPFSLLDLPTESDGTVKRQVYAQGFASTIQVLDEFQAINDVRMAHAAECQ